MDQRTRTLKTLVCLVGAMTSTAVFLGWIDPSVAPTADARSASEIRQLAQAAVSENVALHLQQWHDIEVLAGPAGVSAAPLLAAKPERREAHFLVGLDGRPHRTSRWRKQQPLAGSPHTVRIKVAVVNADRQVTSAQRLCVRALVAALNEGITANTSALPVRVQTHS